MAVITAVAVGLGVTLPLLPSESAAEATTGNVSAKGAAETGYTFLGAAPSTASVQPKVTTRSLTSSPTVTSSKTTASTTATVTSFRPRFWAIEQEANTHSYTLTQATTAAVDFDVITALQGSFKGKVPAMHAANPNLVLYVYMQGIFAQKGEGSAFPASWYVRDPFGNKVKNNWGLWMMDPANPNWVANRVATCKKQRTNSGYDGCFLDNLGAGTLFRSSLSGTPINKATGKAWTDGQWLSATSSIASTIRSAVSPNPVMANGLVRGDAYFDSSAPSKCLLTASNDASAETFIRTAHMGVNQYRDVASWKKDVDMLVDGGAAGKPVLTDTKLWVSATSAQKEIWHQYALASFLLGTNGTGVFTWSGGLDESPLTRFSMSDKVMTIGSPSGAYTALSNGAYQRTFTTGKVIVNPTGSAVTVSLGSAYVTLGGTTVSGSVSVAPHSGRILTK